MSGIYAARAPTTVLLLWCLAAPPLPAQESEMAPPGNLVVDGIPGIPAGLAESARRYTESRTASLQSWHPEKREVLITTRFGDTSQVHRVETPGGARRQLTFFPERVGNASYQPTRGDYFVFSKDIGGSEFYQLFRYDVASGDVTLLTDGKSRNTGASWSHRGDRLAYGSTRRTGRDVDLWVMDPARPETNRRLLELEGGGWFASDWSPDDRSILLLEYISINESYVWLVDVNAGKKTLITPRTAGEKVAYLGGQFSGDGRGFYTTTDRDSEFLQLTFVSLETKKHTSLSAHINWDISDFELSPDGKTIAFVANEDGVGRLHLLDTASGKERRPPPLPTGRVSGLSWHENGRDLGFNLNSVRSPADVYSLDVRTGKLDRWTSSESGGLVTENLSPPESIHWKSFDGRRISGFLYRPSTRFSGKRPVIVVIHGGPEGQSRPGFLESRNYFLEELGVVLIFPNVRGSSGYGKSFLQLDNGLRREDSYKDIGALLDWIATRPDLDADRIMVTGGSYGGFMTLAVATNYDDRIRCSLDIVGISNLVTFLENTQDYRRDLRRAEYGDERDPEVRGFLTRIAPLNNAHRISKPLFIVQGANDPRVPLTESNQMVATVKKNGTPVWYLMARDEGHGFSKKKNRDFQFYATVLFVRKFLLN